MSESGEKNKVFKFEFGGMFMFYSGRNLGEALKQLIKDRPNYLDMLESITKMPEK
jgi:hypothetical protein